MTVLLTAFVPSPPCLYPTELDMCPVGTRDHRRSGTSGQTTTKITTTPNTGRSIRSWISTVPDTFIDILKIDIEGGEFDALTAFLNVHAAAKGDVLPVGQLQLEIRAREGHENFEYFARWWAAGLRPFWTEPNLVYISLVRGVRPEWQSTCLWIFVETMRLSTRRSIEPRRLARHQLLFVFGRIVASWGL
ncbi:hypothetical protein EDB92DRAFT_1070502 [Lactarius akahatsu]|uniref:Methyltransferase FkbM domain-containing protein n=1 Tax=Lactarius akahatsu TaxID=416441 RepID=A0AAD4QBZ5_9AGAM|nr:hypothetical protein EDB92DRAFT_1070502 [Lactarius akahatsu]